MPADWKLIIRRLHTVAILFYVLQPMAAQNAITRAAITLAHVKDCSCRTYLVDDCSAFTLADGKIRFKDSRFSLLQSVSQAAVLSRHGIVTVNRQRKAKRCVWERNISVVLMPVRYFDVRIAEWRPTSTTLLCLLDGGCQWHDPTVPIG